MLQIQALLNKLTSFLICLIHIQNKHMKNLESLIMKPNKDQQKIKKIFLNIHTFHLIKLKKMLFMRANGTKE